MHDDHERPRPATSQQLGDYPQAQVQPDCINLGLGQPSPSLLPMAAIARAAQRRFTASARLMLQYGKAGGTLEQRRALAGFCQRQSGVEIDPDELLVGTSTSAHLNLAAQLLMAKTGRRRVYAEHPSYFLAASIFRDAGAELSGLPVDEHGVSTDTLAQMLASQPPPAFVYVIPTFNNPTGVSLSDQRRQTLIELAQRYDFYVIADEPYNFLNFTGPVRAPLASLDTGSGRVLSLGSFSKLLAPGLRCGWVHACQPLIELFTSHGVLRSGGALNPVIAELVTDAMTDESLDQHVDGLRMTFGLRSRRASAAMQAALPSAKPASGPEGGYFAWYDISRYRNARSLERLKSDLAATGVACLHGPRCATDPGLEDLASFIRISWAFYEAAELETAVQRLARALDT